MHAVCHTLLYLRVSSILGIISKAFQVILVEVSPVNLFCKRHHIDVLERNQVIIQYERCHSVSFSGKKSWNKLFIKRINFFHFHFLKLALYKYVNLVFKIVVSGEKRLLYIYNRYRRICVISHATLPVCLRSLSCR